VLDICLMLEPFFIYQLLAVAKIQIHKESRFGYSMLHVCN
jgi:hypothetical protein